MPSFTTLAPTVRRPAQSPQDPHDPATATATASRTGTGTGTANRAGTRRPPSRTGADRQWHTREEDR